MDDKYSVTRSLPLNHLARFAFKIAEDAGWWPDDVLARTKEFEPRQIATALCLIHTEISEAMEAVRTDDRENFAEELADIIIRVLNLAGGLEVDIDGEVVAKMNANARREHRHGGLLV